MVKGRMIIDDSSKLQLSAVNNYYARVVKWYKLSSTIMNNLISQKWMIVNNYSTSAGLDTSWL